MFGSLLNYFVLKPKPTNQTVNNDISQCGVNDCPWKNTNNTNLALPPSSVVSNTPLTQQQSLPAAILSGKYTSLEQHQPGPAAILGGKYTPLTQHQLGLKPYIDRHFSGHKYMF